MTGVKKVYKLFNKLITVLGFVFIGLGLLLFVIRQMSRDNPQNQPPTTAGEGTPKASNNKPLTTPTQIPVPYIAHFAIFTNGTFRLFDNARYHNQDENVLIEKSHPNTVKVNNSTVTWQYFFSTLPMKLTPECLTTGTSQEFCSDAGRKLRFFVNGIEDAGALSKLIKPQDSLLVTFGNPSEEEIRNQLEKLASVKQ